MSHLLIAPVLLPLFAGAALFALGAGQLRRQRVISFAVTAVLLLVSVLLVVQAEQGQIQVYSLGNWQAPFGIVLVLDRLSALLVLVTAVLAMIVNLYALAGSDNLSRYFHVLFQFQLAGVNGAFLTGDLFNLFVFFEILLIASYALLLHGCGQARLRSALHYVILNMLGSSLFLLGAGLFYGVAGSLNLADLGRIYQQAQGDQQYLLQVAGWIMFLVFGLKAAFLPLHFWLPRAYASASAPVAALFAIMTKVGLYAILRMATLVFAASNNMHLELLFIIALLTMLLGAIGAFAASRLHSMLAYLVLVSVGTILAGIALNNSTAISAILYYLIHSTWIAAGMFLLADVLLKQRGRLGSMLRSGPKLTTPNRLAAAFFIAAIAASGLPPLSGFIGKLGLLQAATGWQALALWSFVLLSGFLVLLALSRAGSLIFWQQQATPDAAATFSKLEFASACLLVASSIGLVVFASSIMDYCQAATAQILQTELYLQQLTGVMP